MNHLHGAMSQLDYLRLWHTEGCCAASSSNQELSTTLRALASEPPVCEAEGRMELVGANYYDRGSEVACSSWIIRRDEPYLGISFHGPTLMSENVRQLGSQPETRAAAAALAALQHTTPALIPLLLMLCAVHLHVAAIRPGRNDA